MRYHNSITRTSAQSALTDIQAYAKLRIIFGYETLKLVFTKSSHAIFWVAVRLSRLYQE